LDRNAFNGELFIHFLDSSDKVGSDAIHLVDVSYPGDMIFVGLLPDCFGLRFHAADGTKKRHSAVKDAQRPFNFNGKIDMTGGINDIYLTVTPETCSGGGGYSNPSLLFLLHPIHGGSAVIHLTDTVGFAGVIKDTLGRSRLTGINMCHDADIANKI
jgi:hypothetical protein